MEQGSLEAAVRAIDAAEAENLQTTVGLPINARVISNSLMRARTSRLRARADCVGVCAAARADRAAARAPLGATYAHTTLTHGRFLVHSA